LQSGDGPYIDPTLTLVANSMRLGVEDLRSGGKCLKSVILLTF
jgi:hypothetical protein